MKKWVGLALLSSLLITSDGFSKGFHAGTTFEYHLRSLDSFSSEVGGNPMLLGGTGYLPLTSEVVIGGRAAASFLANNPGGTSFPMGYAGIFGEYRFLPWLSSALFLGGGAYRLEKILDESENSKHLRKIAKGSFLVLEPALKVNIDVTKGITFIGSVSYFFSTVNELRSMALGFDLLLGRL